MLDRRRQRHQSADPRRDPAELGHADRFGQRRRRALALLARGGRRERALPDRPVGREHARRRRLSRSSSAAATTRLLRDSVFIMLTSATRSGDAARCKELGIAAHLVKPVKQSELYDCDRRGARRISAPDARQPCRKQDRLRTRRGPLRILLAEDSLANQKLAIGLLSKWGHHGHAGHQRPRGGGDGHVADASSICPHGRADAGNGRVRGDAPDSRGRASGRASLVRRSSP